MNLLIRAVITGFGLKLGAEAARLLSKRLRKLTEEREDESDERGGNESEEDEDELPTSIPPDPPLV